MKKVMALPFLLILFLLAAMSVDAATLNVSSEVYQPPQQAKSKATVLKLPLTLQQKMVQGAAESHHVFTLAAPSIAELQLLQNQNTRHKAFQVGIRRELSSLPVVTAWSWHDVIGGQAGQFIIRSEQAARIRVLLQSIQDLPDGVEVRVYDPADTGKVFGPYNQDDFRVDTDTKQNILWTPSIQGEQLGIELFLPQGVSTTSVRLTIPLLSHIVYDIKTQQLKTSTFKAFSSCDISIACAPQIWQETAKSVARYVYTTADGNAFLCSGTLLADLDNTTQLPYFLTAAHCIATAASAATMDFFWMDQESSCGNNDVNPTQVSGGATLLYSQGDLDSTLVLMSSPPPAGAVMSGWSLEPMQSPDTVATIHHGLGNPKQFSEGYFSRYVRIDGTSGGYLIYNDPLGDFFQVHWSQGVTSPGSSGAGLWATVNGEHLLKGNLVGGSSSCGQPDEADEYARLDRFYPYVSEWLGSNYTPLEGLLGGGGPEALTDGVLLGRYLAGIRGIALVQGLTNATIDIETLETKLAEISTGLDLDRDGTKTQERDALLLIRYLLGLRGSKLIEGINLSQSANNTSASISNAIEAFLAGR